MRDRGGTRRQQSFRAVGSSLDLTSSRRIKSDTPGCFPLPFRTRLFPSELGGSRSFRLSARMGLSFVTRPSPLHSRDSPRSRPRPLLSLTRTRSSVRRELGPALDLPSRAPTSSSATTLSIASSSRGAGPRGGRRARHRHHPPRRTRPAVRSPTFSSPREPIRAPGSGSSAWSSPRLAKYPSRVR